MVLLEENKQFEEPFDPAIGSISLPMNTYRSFSIYDIAKAVHETGHAIQYNKNYKPYELISIFSSLYRTGGMAAFYLFFVGLVFLAYTKSFFLINLSFLIMIASILVSLLLIPVEINASMQALNILSKYDFLTNGELHTLQKILLKPAFIISSMDTISFFNILVYLGYNGER